MSTVGYLICFVRHSAQWTVLAYSPPERWLESEAFGLVRNELYRSVIKRDVFSVVAILRAQYSPPVGLSTRRRRKTAIIGEKVGEKGQKGLP
jgi:hypothetical protein